MSPTEPALGTLSYVAVLQDDNQTPQVVASSYDESKTLVLDILNLPNIDSEESFELWVTSKTDNQTRSLGEIPAGVQSLDKALSEAQWRLIADSSFLIISVEDQGGSALGEPSENIVSKGLCIRLARS
jgi:anti-sigma-K factor RskA